MEETNNIVLKKETIKRLLNDVKEIIKNPLTDNGIYYFHDDTNILKGRALIIGPAKTPYENGFYLFEINYPENYPYAPPKLNYCTNDGITRFNPNLYKTGKVCLSILNTWKGEQWTSCQSLSSVLLTLCMVLNENPLINEPGIMETNENCSKYNEIIKYKNIEVAMLSILKNKLIYNKFTQFFPIMKEYFIKHYKDTIQTIDDELKKQKRVCETRHIILSVYYMETVINYKTLKKHLISFYNEITNENTNEIINENTNEIINENPL